MFLRTEAPKAWKEDLLRDQRKVRRKVSWKAAVTAQRKVRRKVSWKAAVTAQKKVLLKAWGRRSGSGWRCSDGGDGRCASGRKNTTIIVTAVEGGGGKKTTIVINTTDEQRQAIILIDQPAELGRKQSIVWRGIR
jgi:hypothetical protein